jgi:purine-binding chemotaxis protein CheW
VGDPAVTGTPVLTFRLAGQEHALPVGDVVEVVRMAAVTPLPEASPWVGGVLNYRGRVIPVVDARARFGMPRRAPDLSTPIVVVRADDLAAGVVVDEAVDVVTLPGAAVRPPDRLGAESPAVSAVARQGERLILVLDAARLCAFDAGPPVAEPPAAEQPAAGGRGW